MKSLEALVLSVVRRLKAVLCRESVKEIRVKLAPVIAMAVLNQKRKDLAELESQHEAQIVVIADHEIGYGEMAAEIERREDEPAEKPMQRHAERTREPEDETVVLGGDAPISFEKALGLDSKVPVTAEAEIKYDRRDAQRAALGERERLRALFESVRPEDELKPEDLQPESAVEEAPRKPERDGRRRKGKAKPESAKELPASAASQIPTPPVVEPMPEPMPEPPVLTGDLLADLVMPTPRPKLLGSASMEIEKVQESPRKRGRAKAEKAEPVVTADPLPEAKQETAKRGRKKAEPTREETAETPRKPRGRTAKTKA